MSVCFASNKHAFPVTERFNIQGFNNVLSKILTDVIMFLLGDGQEKPIVFNSGLRLQKWSRSCCWKQEV